MEPTGKQSGMSSRQLNQTTIDNFVMSFPEASRSNVARKLALRSALRAVPFLSLRGKLITSTHSRFLLIAFWKLLQCKTALSVVSFEEGIASYFTKGSVDHLRKLRPNSRFKSAFIAADYAVTAMLSSNELWNSIVSALAVAKSAQHEEDLIDAILNDLAHFEMANDDGPFHWQPIWQQYPEWWIDQYDAFAIWVHSQEMLEFNWEVWLNWYDSVAKGMFPFNLADPRDAHELEKKIVSGRTDGTFNSSFWSGATSAINAEISQWVAEAHAAEALAAPATKPIFISYTTGDVDQAKRIGEVIDADGYRVFAQYKDMPPGSNFVAEMQSGLATMGKFVPVYSPRYLASDHCQAEWNAAYNMDPLGKRKLIVGFLLEKAELLPLQKQTVYVPLYGLTETQAKSAILTALSTAGAERTPLQTRQAAKDYAVPVPETNAAGQLTFVPSAEVEQPFIDDDVVRLPTSMLRVLGHLLDALEGPNNAPQLVKSLLRGLQGELTVNGAMARVPDLQRDIEMLLAERGRALRDGAVWADGGFGKGINQLEAMFSSYRQNFPLVMVREIERRQAAIDPAKFDDASFHRSHESIAVATQALGDAGQADSSVAHVVSQRQRQRRDIEILGRYVPRGSDRFVVRPDERTVDELKKDFMFDESGLWDRTLGRVEKVTSIADSTGGKALIVAAKEFLKSIWGG